jgi:iron complex outermembrane receptor protein
MTSSFYNRALFATLAASVAMPAFANAALAADATTAGAATNDPGSSTVDAGGNAATGNLGDIVVTARKRKESVLDVPVAISALSKADLDKLNVKTIEDLVQDTPGVVINNATTGAARSDRSESAVIIRGMAPTVGNQTTSIFVNGVPVTSGAVTGIFDLQRSEVLEGPQSAYFGRETFAGAINLITAEPTDTWTGFGSATGASSNYYDINGAIGGPIVADLLSFRASARVYSRDGTWNNAAESGQTLGDQNTKSATLMLKFTPSSHLTIKLFGALANDRDGPGPTGVIEPDQSNCTLASGTKYFCGTLPGLEAGQPGEVTTVTSGVKALQTQYTSLLRKSEVENEFGLKREARSLSASIDYVTDSGISISSLTGFNQDHFNVLYDLNGRPSPYPAVNTGYPFLATTDWPLEIEHTQHDISTEVRIASKQNERFRWLAGASYLYQTFHERYGELYYFSGLDAGDSGIGTSKTVGGFFGLAFDLTHKLTINFDGRVQRDQLIARDGVSNALTYQKAYTNFMPRATLQYKPDHNTMVYFTYSKGVNPGLGRDPLLSVPEGPLRDQLRADGITDGVKPEKLDNFELGFKGKLFHDRLVIAGDVYWDIWKDKITEETIIIPVPGSTPDEVNVYTNLGQVTLKGIELSLDAAPFDHLTAHLGGALNDSHIDYGACAICLTQTGSANAAGHELGNISKYSALGWVEYAHPLGRTDFDWYFRPDFTYKSGMWDSDGDYAKTPHSLQVDFRAGIRSKQITVEAFVTNTFNNKGYTSILPDWQLDNPAETYGKYDTLFVGLPYLRTYGVKATFNF